MSLLDQAAAQARTACSMSLSDDATAAGNAGVDAAVGAAGAVATSAVGLTACATGATTGATTAGVAAGVAATGFAELGLPPVLLGLRRERPADVIRNRADVDIPRPYSR